MYRLSLVVACGLVALCDSGIAAQYVEDEIAINGIAGLTAPDDPVRFAMLETRAQISTRVAIAAAVAYLEGANGYEDLQLRLAATGTLAIGRWTFENRHMVSAGTESSDRYRNRLRVMRPGLFGQPNLSARAFDELFVDMDRGRLMRNNVAMGVGVQLRSAWSAELYHVWVDNRGARNDNYVLALLTLRL